MVYSMKSFYKLDIGSIIRTTSFTYKVVDVNDSNAILIKNTFTRSDTDYVIDDTTFSMIVKQTITTNSFELFILPRVIKFPIDLISNIKLLKENDTVNISILRIPCSLYNGHKFCNIGRPNGDILDPIPAITDIHLCTFRLDRIIKTIYGIYYYFNHMDQFTEQQVNHLNFGSFNSMYRNTRVRANCSGYYKDDQCDLHILDLVLYIDLDDFSEEDESNE